MIKRYCDGCGEEIIRNYVRDRLVRSLQLEGVKFGVEVQIKKKGVWNEGDLCLNCVLKIVNEGRVW